MPQKPKTKSYKEYKSKWKDCSKCGLCESRYKIVLARGTIPADVIFIGEAPGQSEDTLGRPFVGPAGKLLDSMVEKATESLEKPIRCIYTNLVSCIPLDPNVPTKKMTEPPDWAIKACGDRLNELINLADPRAIIMVGKLSAKWCPKIVKRDFEFSADILHPAAILRADISQQGMAVQKTIITLEDLFWKFAQSTSQE